MFGYFFSVSYRFISFYVGVCDDDINNDDNDDSSGEFGINVFSSIIDRYIVVLFYYIVLFIFL